MNERMFVGSLRLAAVLWFAGPAAAADAGTAAVTTNGLPRGYAASAFEAPVAFGASWGSVGLAILEAESGPAGRDSSVAAAAGLGDPDRWIGVDVAAVVSSLSDSQAGSYGFGEEGSFSLKLHRNLGHYTAIAAGAGAIGRWGGDAFMRNNNPGYYVAATRAVFVGDSVLMLSGGGGRNLSHYGHDALSAFGAVAFYPVHWLSLIGEYSGYTVDAAISVAPFPRWLPLTLTSGFVDLASQRNHSPRLTTIASLGYRF